VGAGFSWHKARKAFYFSGGRSQCDQLNGPSTEENLGCGQVLSNTKKKSLKEEKLYQSLTSYFAS
jgi:hypothetical protein